MANIYIDNVLALSLSGGVKGDYYINTTSTGIFVQDDLSVSNNYTWTYSGSEEFLGLSLTQGSSNPDSGYSVGSTYTYPASYPLYLYTVTAGLLTVKYNNSTIYNTSEDGTFTLTTKGKYLPYDIEVNATLEASLIEDASAAATDILSGYTAYVNNNQKITGSMPTFNGSITYPVIFTIDGVSYSVTPGTTWAEWVEDNSSNFEIIKPNEGGVPYEIIDKIKSTITGREPFSNENIDYCNGTFYYFKPSNTLEYYSTTIIEAENITTSINYGTGPL